MASDDLRVRQERTGKRRSPSHGRPDHGVPATPVSSLLVDRVTEFEAGRSITGIKNVTANEQFFEGNLPGHCIMPGVFILESMAQVGGLLLLDESDPEGPRQIFYLAGMDNAGWRRPVTPGDQLVIRATLLKARRKVFRVAVEASVDGELVTSAEITCQLAPVVRGLNGTKEKEEGTAL